MNTEEGVVDSPQPETLAETSTDALREIVATQPEAETTGIETEAQAQPGLPEEPQAEETTQIEEPAPEEAEERLIKRRIRPRTELDQQVIDLYRSDGFSGSFADASRVIFGQDQPAPQVQQQVEANRPDPMAGYDAAANELSRQVNDLEAKVKEAADNLETADALGYQREIMRKELQIQSLHDRKSQINQRQQDHAYETHRSKAVESRDRAYTAYPELQDKTGVFRKQFDDFVAQAQQDSDFATVFQSPHWPEIMANDFATRSGYSKQAPAVPTQHSPPMGTQAKVLTTGNTAQPANAPMSPETVVANMDQLSNDQLYSILGSSDGRRQLT